MHKPVNWKINIEKLNPRGFVARFDNVHGSMVEYIGYEEVKDPLWNIQRVKKVLVIHPKKIEIKDVEKESTYAKACKNITFILPWKVET